MRKTTIIILFIFYAGLNLPAQTASLTIGTSAVCAGEEVFLPVTAADLYNVGAITLYINFDTNNLTYMSLENIDPQLAGLNSNFVPSPPQLIVVWSDITGANFPLTKFFDIKFQFNSETTAVQFDPGSEIADLTLQIIPVDYINGSVESSVPVITGHPHDTTVTAGNSASFQVISPNATQYFWKESSDHGATWEYLQNGGIYSGVNTDELLISQVPSTYNTYMYKCLVLRMDCPGESNSAILMVDTLSPVYSYADTRNYIYQNRPNPVKRFTTFEFFIPSNGYVRLTIHDITGQIVALITEDDFTSGRHAVQFDAGSLAAGIYFYKMAVWNNITNFAAAKRMIKL